MKAINNYEVGKNYPGIVTKVQDYGVFCKLADGLEGLIHQSELSYTKTKIHPGKLLTTTQKIMVQVLDKNPELRRLSLSFKRTQENPWDKFTKNYKEGDQINGTVKNITNFALFISIDNSELDGMVHFKDLDFSEKETELEKYKKNQKLRLKILEVNQEKEKIRLGIKQLGQDPFEFFSTRKVSDIVTSIVNYSNNSGVYVNAGNKGPSILIKKSQLAIEPENQRPSRWTKGDRVDAKIISLNKDKREVQLSIKSLLEDEQKSLIKRFGSKDSGRTLGSILGPLLKKKSKTKKE